MFPLIKLDGICKFYGNGDGKVIALNDVSLDVKKGDILAVLGNSGSGKSTLMNIIGCLDSPSKGKYLLDGENVQNMSDKQLSFVRGKTIGFIFQSFNLIPSLTAIENVELPLAYKGVQKTKCRELAVQALEKVGLADRMKHLPSELSGGQQQRVAIARAIASSPPLILADEPTGNLDVKSGREVMDIIWKLNEEGHTVIIITHDQNLAATVPSKIVISDGKIVQKS